MTVAQYKALIGKKSSRRLVRLDEYDSDAERAFAQAAVLLFNAQLREIVIEVRHHPLTLRLPGGSYRPDFRVRTAKGFFIVEVKPGNRASRKTGKIIKPGKNRRDARSKLRAAAELFPEYTFIEARCGSTRDPLNWELEIIR